MVNSFKFEELRKDLLKECFEWSADSIVTIAFKKSFFRLVEHCIFSLMEQKENFFAHFIIQLKREINPEISTATATRPNGISYILYFNPAIFLECSLEEMKALLKHEVYHIISLHHIRSKSLLQIYSAKAVSLAMDISINQYIINLPLWSEKLENVSLSYNITLKPEATMEEYASLIQKAMDSMRNNKSSGDENGKDFDQQRKGMTFSNVKHDIEKAHYIWSYSDYETDSSQIKEITKQLVMTSTRGEIPESIGSLISSFKAIPELDWMNQLKRLIGTIQNESKKTITRRDRRQPDRLDIRGRLNKYTADIVVAIDISGSMSDKEIERIMTEVIFMVRNYNHKLSVIECDNDIRRVYSVKNIKDIKPKLNTRGGTKFGPVFKYIKENYSTNTLLVYFTDGIGEREIDTNYNHRRVLWVLTGKEEDMSLIDPPGIIKKLTNTNKKEQNVLAIEYLKNELNDIRSEWAK